MLLLRELHTLIVQFGFLLRAVHRPGALNTLADALSRNDVDTFIRLAPYPQAFFHCLQVPAATRACLINALRIKSARD